MHEPAKLSVALLLLLTFVAFAPCATAEPAQWSAWGARDHSLIHTSADLDREISCLSDPSKRVDAYCALLAFTGGVGASTGDSDAALVGRANRAIRSCSARRAILAAVKHRLSDPAQRLGAVAALIRLAGMQAYPSGSVMTSSGDNNWDAFQRSASAALAGAGDVATVTSALDDQSEQDVRAWSLSVFGGSASPKNDWLALLPAVERHTDEDELNVGIEALDVLSRYPSEDDFLRQFVDREADPARIVRVLEHTDPVDYKIKLRAKVYAGLANPDADVRKDSLLVIGAMRFSGPTHRFEMDRPTFDRVIDLTKSSSDAERSNAAFGLEACGDFDADASRIAFVRLASDRLPDIRWRAGWVLGKLDDRDDVTPAVDRLLNDPVPEVRYMTILSSGPAKYVSELRALTTCSDADIAQSAKQTLAQLAKASLAAKQAAAARPPAPVKTPLLPKRSPAKLAKSVKPVGLAAAAAPAKPAAQTTTQK